jgi:hypothetical protein
VVAKDSTAILGLIEPCEMVCAAAPAHMCELGPIAVGSRIPIDSEGIQKAPSATWPRLDSIVGEVIDGRTLGI